MEPDLAAATFWASPRGAEALDAAKRTRGAHPLARRAALDRGFSPNEARLALVQDDLRVRAAAKTPLSERLLFTKDALEQATSAVVAADRAARFASFRIVADLGASVGLDTLALAAAGREVVAVERDPVRAALLAWNVRAAGFADRVRVLLADFVTAPPEADAAFLDPDRRPGGRRHRAPELFEPPASAWDALAARYGHLLAKLAPATLAEWHEGRGVEWVSEDGAMKEARVGWGALAIPAARRARILPAGTALEGTGRPWPTPRAPKPGDLLLDPDPAVVVAGLVGEAAEAAGAAPVHPRIAFLVGSRAMPWATAVRVEEVMSASPRAIQERLDARGIGDLTIRSRGVEDPPDVWRKRLRPKGPGRATLVLSRGPDDRYFAALGSVPGTTGAAGAIVSRPGPMP